MATVIAKDINSTVTLSDGVEMPLFGLGTFESPTGGGLDEVIKYAIDNGYRMIDTAQYYGNEEDVGSGIKKSGKADVFAVTKVRMANHGYDLTVSSVKESLTKLGKSHIDLVLIHSPNTGKNIATYQALLDLQKQGIVRSVGVSNFHIEHLEGMKKAGLPMPAVNQFEAHPFQCNEDLVKYCRDHKIAVMGYCPLVRNKASDDPDLLAIAKRHNKSVSQVLIRWSLQQGHITIPKTTNPARILENSHVFDFSLTEQDLDSLKGKSEIRCGMDMHSNPWTD